MAFLLIGTIFACDAGLTANSQLGPDSENSSHDSGTSSSAPNGQSQSTGGANGTTSSPQFIFEAVSVDSSLRKIKTILSGQALTSSELEQGSSQDGFENLVDAWVHSTDSDGALIDFFAWAFQTSQMSENQAYAGVQDGHPPAPLLRQHLRQSMPRTALSIVRAGQPFSEVATTSTFMVTPNLAAWLVMADDKQIDDRNKSIEYETQQNPNWSYLMVDNANIPLSQSADPQDPDYLIFTSPALTTDCNNLVLNHSYRVDKKTLYGDRTMLLYYFLWVGAQYTNLQFPTYFCKVYHTNNTPRLSQAALSVWRPVTIRKPKMGERPTPIWDFDALQNGSTLILNSPHVGYFGDAAFLTQCETNINNQGRVTANQALFVGLNKLFDGSDQTAAVSLAALSSEHADPKSVCFSCHRTMDPMRQIFRQNFTLTYHEQKDPNQINLQGVWAQDGVSAIASDVSDFGRYVVQSPNFALAWVQKACTWINSSPCDRADPKLLNIAEKFQASQFDFLNMFRDVLVSDSTTYLDTSSTVTTNGEIFSLARRSRLCRVFASRLNLTDPCGLYVDTPLTSNLRNFANLMIPYAEDGYRRNSAIPVMPAYPTIPMRTSLETACSWLALEVVDGAANTRFSSTNPNVAIASMISDFMNVDDASSAEATTALTDHYGLALSQKVNASTALRSTFVAACVSPYVINAGAL